MLKRFVHTLGLAEPSDKDQRSKSHHHQVKNKGNKSQVRGTKVSPDISLRSNDFVVRIVHKGGSLEVYQNAFPAFVLLEKYPGMCVASSGVFRDPHRSVLKPEDVLLLGHKYIIIPYREVEKLKRKYPLQGEAEEPNVVVRQEKETLEAKITKSPIEHKHKHRENGEVRVLKGVHGKEVMEKPQTRTRLSPNGCRANEESKVIGERKEGSEMNLVQGGGSEGNSYGYAKDYYLVPKEKSTRHARRTALRRNKPFVPPLPKTRPYKGLRWKPRLPTIPELSP